MFDDEGKEDIKEIETSIKYRLNNEETGNDENTAEASIARLNEIDDDKEKEDDEDEGRTPWGDAEARRR